MIDAKSYRQQLDLEQQLPSVLDELQNAPLGDKRRVERMLDIVEMLHDDPAQSFPEAVNGNDAALKGLYRFFSNPAVTMESELKPHFEATFKRVETVGRCFAVHDTSELSFAVNNDVPTRKGLDHPSTRTQCLRIHPTLMVAANGSRLPLGLAAMMTWARTPEDSRQRPQHWAERDRWFEQALAVEEHSPEGAEIIHLMDRDADSYDLLAILVEAGARFVVRMKHNRNLSAPTDTKIIEALQHKGKSGERTITLSRRTTNRSPSDKKKHPPRETRTARVAVRATEVEFERTGTSTKTEIDRLRLNVVEVSEIDVPDGEDPVAWYLLTTEPIDTVEQCWQVVDDYCARWTIEEYFHSLKTGCALEDRQLQSRDALETMLGIMLPLAWRVLLMRHLPRISPDADAQVLFAETELEILREVTHRPMDETPSLKQACWAMAALGGHLKRSGPPGWKTLWKGFRKLRQRHQGYLMALRRSGQR